MIDLCCALQELARYEIDVRNIVINQLIFPEAGKPPPTHSAVRNAQVKHGKSLWQWRPGLGMIDSHSATILHDGQERCIAWAASAVCLHQD